MADKKSLSDLGKLTGQEPEAPAPAPAAETTATETAPAVDAAVEAPAVSRPHDRAFSGGYCRIGKTFGPYGDMQAVFGLMLDAETNRFADFANAMMGCRRVLCALANSVPCRPGNRLSGAQFTD